MLFLREIFSSAIKYSKYASNQETPKLFKYNYSNKFFTIRTIFLNSYDPFKTKFSSEKSNYHVLNSPKLKFLKNPTLLIPQYRYAGHSHWKNIKATKELNDAIKQKVNYAIVRKIKVAVQEGGGQTNPKLNSFLARVIEEGKNKDVPGITMTNAILRLEKTKEKKGSSLLIEARVLGGCSLLIECLTEKPKWLRQNAQHVFKKYGGKIAEGGTCQHLFQQKGVLYLIPNVYSDETNLKELTLDEAFDIAIEAGAEEVIEDVDKMGDKIFKFITDTKELHEVKKNIITEGLKPYESRLEYLPNTFVTLDQQNLDLASQMIDELEAMDDVLIVFHNIDSEY